MELGKGHRVGLCLFCGGNVVFGFSKQTAKN
jgi:hypothetical protein